MKALILFLILIIAGCKKSHLEPTTPAQEPSPTIYYKLGTKNNLYGRTSAKKTDSDTIYYTLKVNGAMVYTLKAIPTVTSGIYVDAFTKSPAQIISPPLTIKSGDNLVWGISYRIKPTGTVSDKVAFNFNKAWVNEYKSVTDPLGPELVVYSSLQKDTIPFINTSGNIWIAEKFYSMSVSK